MKCRRVLEGGFLAGAGLLLYGGLFETDRLVKESSTLWLPRWPESLDGYRVGLLTDLHLRDSESIALTQTAIEACLDERPDAIVICGDLVDFWKPESHDILVYALAGLELAPCLKVAVPGNHDYYGGGPEQLLPALEPLGVRLLRNESLVHDGIRWVGMDSAVMGRSDLLEAFCGVPRDEATVLLWHEPEIVPAAPDFVSLMLSGHSHGGQFCTPWGWAPGRAYLGSTFLSGFFEDAPVPLYVSRGIGITGPPARLFCRPEVAILTLRSCVV